MKWRVAAALAGLMLCACGPAPTQPALGPTRTPLAATPLIAITPSSQPASTLPVTGYPPISPAPITSEAAPAPTMAATQTRPPAAHQLTAGGCCVQPFWSADGSQVRYIDRPSSGEPGGIWAVSAQGGPPTFVSARLGLYSPDETLVAFPEGGETYIECVGGQPWKVPTGGRALLFSPDSAQIAWQVASSTVNFDSRQVQIWVAAVDGTGAHKVADLVGGGLNAWFPDGRRLLVTSRTGDQSQVEILNLADGSRTSIAQAARFQGVALSPAGGWVAYTVAFSGDPGQDGLFVQGTDGRATKRLEPFGAIAWRAEGRLLVIPLEPSAPNNRLLEADAETGLVRPLTDPAFTPLQIAGGNWALSPDGRRLAFVAAADHNLWILDLPD